LSFVQLIKMNQFRPFSGNNEDREFVTFKTGIHKPFQRGGIRAIWQGPRAFGGPQIVFDLTLEGVKIDQK